MQLRFAMDERFQTLHQNRLRADLSSDLNIPAFLAEIDRRPGLTGAGVVYFDGADVLVIRKFKPVCQIIPVYVVIRSVPRGTISNNQPTTSTLEHENSLMYSVLREASSAGIACTAAILGWVAVMGSSLSTVPTGGASGAVAVFAWSSAVASSLQCGIGVARTMAVRHGYDENLAWFDSQSWYTQTMTALDIVSLAGGGAALVGFAKTQAALKTAGNASVLEALKGLSRHERKRLTENLIRRMHPGISNASIKAYIRAGVYPARYGSAEISHALRMELTSAAGAALSFGGSAVSGTLGNPPRLRDLAFGLFQPLQTL